jgi:deoxyribonuclease V
MIAKQLHDWHLNPAEARILQTQLAKNVIKKNLINKVDYIAGVDVSILPDNMGRAAVVILSYPHLEIVEIQTTIEHIDFPYIPGLLSFREIPILVSTLKKLSNEPDIIYVDGQGIAHPRRLGLASHIGLMIDKPTIGCAKSLLCGSYGPLAENPGAFSNIIDKDEIIGVALRTRMKIKPMLISIGHRVDLPGSIEWVMNACKGYKLPEPTRLAHLASTGNL